MNATNKKNQTPLYTAVTLRGNVEVRAQLFPH